MICYDIYDGFTMEHFPLCQSMNLTTNFFFCSRQYVDKGWLYHLVTLLLVITEQIKFPIRN
jgi:hypothetical protein